MFFYQKFDAKIRTTSNDNNVPTVLPVAKK